MRELIIGMDGRIGSRLCRHLPDAIRTTRRDFEFHERPNTSYFDVLKDYLPLPGAEVVYICIGVNGTLTCARDPHTSYRTNVDGTISIAEMFRNTAFVVWISSMTVEWMTEHYGRQKRITENYLRAMPNVGIIRAGRVTPDNIDELCELMIHVGRTRKPGLVLWNENEQPYK